MQVIYKIRSGCVTRYFLRDLNDMSLIMLYKVLKYNLFYAELLLKNRI